MIKVNPKGLSYIQKKAPFSLGVSLGSSSLESDNLRAIVDWLNEFGFSEGIIDLSDALYRYTYLSQGLPQQEAMTRSIEDGDAWLNRNQSIIQGLNMPFKIIRWSNWLKNPKFYDYMRYFLAQYEQKTEFRAAVDADIERYEKRKYGVSLKASNVSSYAQSVNYFCEELSVHSILFEQYPSVSIYPGSQLETYKGIRAGKLVAPTDGIRNSKYLRLCLYEDKITRAETRISA